MACRIIFKNPLTNRTRTFKNEAAFDRYIEGSIQEFEKFKGTGQKTTLTSGEARALLSDIGLNSSDIRRVISGEQAEAPPASREPATTSTESRRTAPSSLYQKLQGIPGMTDEQALEAYKNLYRPGLDSWKDSKLEC